MGDQITDSEFISAHTKSASVTPFMDSVQPIEVDRYVERLEWYKVIQKETNQNQFGQRYTFDHEFNDSSYVDFSRDAFIQADIAVNQGANPDLVGGTDSIIPEWGIPWFNQAQISCNGVIVQTIRYPQFQFMIRALQQKTKMNLDQEHEWFRLYDTAPRLYNIETLTATSLDDIYASNNDYKVGLVQIQGNYIPSADNQVPDYYDPNGFAMRNPNAVKRWLLMGRGKYCRLQIPLRYFLPVCESLRYIPLSKIQIELQRGADNDMYTGQRVGNDATFAIDNVEFHFRKTFLAPTELEVQMLESIRSSRFIPFSFYEFDEKAMDMYNSVNPITFRKTTRGLIAMFQMFQRNDTPTKNYNNRSLYQFAFHAFQKKIIRYAGRMIESGVRDDSTPRSNFYYWHDTYEPGSGYHCNNLWQSWLDTVPASKGDSLGTLMSLEMFKYCWPIITTRFDLTTMSEGGSNFALDTRPLESIIELYLSHISHVDDPNRYARLISLAQLEAAFVIGPSGLTRIMNIQ
jgi:hypothetical protein